MYAYFDRNIFTFVCYSNILITMAKAAAAAILFFLFSTTGPFQGHNLPFQGKTFFFSV
jgi:hypothetical protein